MTRNAENSRAKFQRLVQRSKGQSAEDTLRKRKTNESSDTTGGSAPPTCRGATARPHGAPRGRRAGRRRRPLIVFMPIKNSRRAVDRFVRAATEDLPRPDTIQPEFFARSYICSIVAPERNPRSRTVSRTRSMDSGAASVVNSSLRSMNRASLLMLSPRLSSACSI